MSIDWAGWLARWDAQQAGYLSRREERFAVMLDLVEALRGAAPRVLDLACGPGSIAQRLLARLPDASAVAVDVDPVLLTLGREALGDVGGRLQWVSADLRDPAWPEKVPAGPYDAALTTTALHWLQPADLLRVYRDVAGLLAPGGVLANGDHLAFPHSQPTLRRAVETVTERRHQEQDGAGVERWDDWWAGLAAEPGLEVLFAERERLALGGHHGPTAPGLALHQAALLGAGFVEVGVVWSDLDDRVLVGIADDGRDHT